MKTKLFTNSQLIGVMAFAFVIATIVVLFVTKDFSSFANQIQ